MKIEDLKNKKVVISLKIEQNAYDWKDIIENRIGDEEFTESALSDLIYSFYLENASEDIFDCLSIKLA